MLFIRFANSALVVPKENAQSIFCKDAAIFSVIPHSLSDKTITNIERRNGTSCHGSLAIVFPIGLSDFFSHKVTTEHIRSTPAHATRLTSHISTPIYEEIASITVQTKRPTSPMIRQGLSSIFSSCSCGFSGSLSFFAKSAYKIANEQSPAKTVGIAIILRYCANTTPYVVAR